MLEFNFFNLQSSMFNLKESFLDGSAGAEDVDFYLFLANTQDGGNVAVALAFYVAQLHTTTLFLGQLVNELAHQLNAVTLYSMLLGVRRQPVVKRVNAAIERLHLIVHAPQFVERQIAADSQTEGLNRLYALPFVASVPYFYHCFLHNILRLRRILGDAERQTIQFVFQRQDIGLETNHFLLLTFLSPFRAARQWP